MTIRSTWTDLSARLHGLIDASKLAADLFRDKGDALGVIVRLRDHARAILSDLRSFRGRIAADSPSAAQAIDRVAEQIGGMLVDESSTQDTRQIHIRSAIVILAALDGEISYLLRDSQDAIRSRAERAFEHLQRLILVDDDVRTKWRAAYATSEVKCEQLGAVHLLHHAIWAFKVNAEKGRTDLVYQDRLTNTTLIERASEGLVLTEWKRYVAGVASLLTLVNEARDQAENYSAGILAGIELTNTRYIIVVSERRLEMPGDLAVGARVYRHINIQVDPQTPSKA